MNLLFNNLLVSIVSFMEICLPFQNIKLYECVNLNESEKIKQYKENAKWAYMFKTGQKPEDEYKLVNLSSLDIAHGHWDTYRVGWIQGKDEETSEIKDDDVCLLHTSLGDFAVSKYEYLDAENGEDIIGFYLEGKPVTALLKKHVGINSSFYKENLKYFEHIKNM